MLNNTPSPDKLEELRRLRRMAQLKKDYGLLFYRPHEKQDAFHAAGAKKRRYARTGNRFGKSTMGAAEDASWARGERPWYPKGDPRRTVGLPKHATKGLIIVADWDKAHEIFTNPMQGAGQGKLFQLLPKDSIVKTSRNNAGVISEIHIKSIHGGESIIMMDTVKSYMSNPMGHESSVWDWIHVDEPCPQSMWIANSRGLIDRFGSAWFTCTPISEPWINDMFVPSRRLRINSDEPVIKDEHHWMITGKSSDNPYTSAEALEMFAEGLDENEKQCRLYGLPLALSGIIYKEFDREVHVFKGTPKGWKSPIEPPKDYTIRMAIDPHTEQPHAVLFAATAPDGTVFIFHELFRKVLVGQLCESIHEVTMGYDVLYSLCDLTAFKEHPTDGSSMADVFIENGVFVEKAPRDLDRGILQVQALLGRRGRTPDGKVIPKIYFMEHLQETLWEFDHYIWDIKRFNKPVDKDDHMMENLYRLVVTGLEWVPPEKMSEKFFDSRVRRAELVVPRYEYHDGSDIY